MLYKFLAFLLIFLFSVPCYSETISGNVRQDEYNQKKNMVIDSASNKPIQGAKVSVPQYDFYTSTDKNGRFQLNANIEDKAILQVEKDGYKPFSITIDRMVETNPLKLGLEKTSPLDLYIQTGVFHLGDNIFSPNSANCRQFRLKSNGSYYHKKIKLNKPENGKEAVIVFGSIIGLDTKLAKELGQNAIVSVYSSPLQIIFNGQTIAEINLNGDNQQVVIPNSLIRETNDLTVQTGKNLFQYEYSDYDDMEFANLRIEVRDKTFANK